MLSHFWEYSQLLLFQKPMMITDAGLVHELKWDNVNGWDETYWERNDLVYGGRLGIWFWEIWVLGGVRFTAENWWRGEILELVRLNWWWLRGRTEWKAVWSYNSERRNLLTLCLLYSSTILSIAIWDGILIVNTHSVGSGILESYKNTAISPLLTYYYTYSTYSLHYNYFLSTPHHALFGRNHSIMQFSQYYFYNLTTAINKQHTQVLFFKRIPNCIF